MDKRQVYDWDTRIHLLCRGPGIAKGAEFKLPATQVDMAPTFLALAGLQPPPTFDGKSLVPHLVSPTDPELLPLSTAEALSWQGASRAESTASWRTAVLLEYYYNADNDKCMNQSSCSEGFYPQRDTWCGDLDHNKDCWGPSPQSCNSNCYPTETTQNNYIGLRTLVGSNTLYVEYQTGNLGQAAIEFDAVDFVEIYDLDKDPWQMHNTVNETGASEKAAMQAELHKWYQCAGASCP